MIQSTDNSVTPKDKTPNIAIPPMFRTNLAKTGLIYPNNHPYYKGITTEEVAKAITYLPPNNLFFKYPADERIMLHPLHGKNELASNLNAVELLLTHRPKAKIKLMPVIYAKQASARSLYLSEDYIKKFPNKNPDIMLDAKPADIKCVSNSASSIHHAIRNGKKQAELVIIHLNEDTLMEDATRWAKGKLTHGRGKEKLTVWLMNSKELVVLSTSARHKSQ